MTIIGISDAWLVGVGIVYPAYEMLVHRNDPNVLQCWQKYFVVFALSYCVLEMTEYVVSYWAIPTLKFIGIPLLVWSHRLTTYTYDNQLLPVFVKHEQWLAQILGMARNQIQERFGGTLKYLSSFLPPGHPLSVS